MDVEIQQIISKTVLSENLAHMLVGKPTYFALIYSQAKISCLNVAIVVDDLGYLSVVIMLSGVICCNIIFIIICEVW